MTHNTNIENKKNKMKTLKANLDTCCICGCKVRIERVALDRANHCHKHYSRISKEERAEVLKIKKAHTIKMNKLMDELLGE